MLFNSLNVQTVEAEITAPMPPQRARDAGIRVRNTMSNGPLRVRRNRDFPAVFRNVLPASEARDVLASVEEYGDFHETAVKQGGTADLAEHLLIRPWQKNTSVQGLFLFRRTRKC